MTTTVSMFEFSARSETGLCFPATECAALSDARPARLAAAIPPSNKRRSGFSSCSLPLSPVPLLLLMACDLHQRHTRRVGFPYLCALQARRAIAAIWIHGQCPD